MNLIIVLVIITSLCKLNYKILMMLKSPPPFFITCFIRSPVNWFSFPPHFSIRTSLSASFHPLLILPSPLFSLYVLNLASCLSLSLSLPTQTTSRL